MKIYNTADFIKTDFTYDSEKNEYCMKTNGKDGWWKKDELALVYDRYEILYGERSVLRLETTITEFEEYEFNASAGLMIRCDDVPEAANAFLLIRRNNVLLTFRKNAGEDTHCRQSSVNGGIKYPIKLRIEMVGSVVTGSYCLADSDEWKKVGSVSLPNTTEVLAGFSGYAVSPQCPITVKFTDYQTYLENKEPISISGSGEKAELSEDVLFFEDFETGEVNTNPRNGFCWSNVFGANIVETEDANGNPTYAWFKDHMDNIHTVGSKRWADYSLEADIKFPEEVDKQEDNVFGLFVRQREMDFYGFFNYGIFLKKGNQLEIRKTLASNANYNKYAQPVAKTDFEYLNDPGEWHHIRVDAFDNKITVFWDGTELLEYVDNAPLICPVGKVGFMTENTAVYIDNFTVRELDDPLGGAYDNLVGGLWDQPTPEDFVYSYDESKPQISYSKKQIDDTGKF